MYTFYSKIKQQQQLHLPFVVYCKPNATEIQGFFQTDAVLYEVEDFSEQGFVFASFDGDKKYLIPRNASENLSFPFEKKTVEIPLPIDSNPTIEEQNHYEQLVAKGINTINAGTFQKVVLSRQETVKSVNFDFATVFERLLQTYPTAFVYCFYHPKVGLWMGATPEQLVKVKGRNFETMALAGTQKATQPEAVIWASKEKEEQQLVTDYIVSQLNTCVDTLAVSEPFTVAAGTICHLKTTIKGSFKAENSLQKIIALLHPTPAVCGMPALVAKDFIMANESYYRSFYTGFLGELNIDSSTDLFVNLRCMQVETETVLIYIGCGITKDSVPAKEWEESVNKAAIMKRVLSE